VLALADAGSAVIQASRAWSEEQQNHKETWSYPQIMEELVARGAYSRAPFGFVRRLDARSTPHRTRIRHGLIDRAHRRP
jgi:hypothetical protein